MLDTEESSSDEDADWSVLESKNAFLRLMALGKAKTVMNQYLLQDIDGLDVKLLFGIYQRKVLGYEERTETYNDILEKILTSKKHARQLAVFVPPPDLPTLREPKMQEAEMYARDGNEKPTRLDLMDKYAA